VLVLIGIHDARVHRMVAELVKQAGGIPSDEPVPDADALLDLANRWPAHLAIVTYYLPNAAFPRLTEQLRSRVNTVLLLESYNQETFWLNCKSRKQALTKYASWRPNA
jgi:hypothetical protein